MTQHSTLRLNYAQNQIETQVAYNNLSGIGMRKVLVSPVTLQNDNNLRKRSLNSSNVSDVHMQHVH